MSNPVPPGPKGNLLLGNLREYREDTLSWLVEAASYGDISRWRFGPFNIYQLNHPDPIREVLVKKAKSFHKTRLNKEVFKDSLGTGLLVSDGEFWRRQRRLVQPVFHHQRIEAYAQVMVGYSLQTLEEWSGRPSVDIDRAMMELTLKVVSKTLFDTDVSHETFRRVGDVMEMGQVNANRAFLRLVAPPRWLPIRENRERMLFTRTMDEIILGMIEERRATGEDRGDLLSMLLTAVDEEDGGEMTDKQVRDEAVTLFIAGHETTAVALTWTWVLLSQHPQVEERLHAELDRELAGRPPTVADLERLPYTEKVIKEAMRLYPPAWIFAREAIEAVEIGGYSMRKGSIFFFSPYVLHRDGRFFEDPLSFRPERFDAGFEEAIPRYAYIPFGAGPRICIGNAFALMEARLILATLAQSVRLRLEPDQRVEPDPLITLRPDGSVPMQVAQRALAAVPLAT